MSQPSTRFCPSGHPNRAGAKFCATCRAPLQPTSSTLCPNCRNLNPPGQMFCAHCHSPLSTQPMMGNVFSTTLPANSHLRGRYTIVRLVGGGGMGSVYEALDAHLHGRRVAIKELNSALMTNPQETHSAIAMFQQEAQLLATLQHPNLPRVSDFFIEGNKQYLVMDFVDGRTLEKVVSDGGLLSEYQVALLGAQLCSVLAYLHACRPPIIFRDLKPANIMLDNTNQIKLIDFGIARLYKPGHRTDTHQFGSPGYAPPEQYGHNQTDARSDVYSLAVTLYYLLTRHDPALTPFNQPALRQLNPSVSPQLEQIVTRGMAHDPNQRWQNANEFGNALSNYRPIPGGGVGQTSRPTTRLILKAAELPVWQLALAITFITIGAFVAAYIFTPLVARIPLIWDNLDVIAVIAPLAYAATRQRFVAGIAHATIATLGGIAVWSSLGYAPAVPLILVIALVVGAFAEVWLAFLPRVRGKGTDPWQREVAWLAGLAVIVTAATRILLVSFGFGANPVLWFVSALIGGVGWFIGDLIQQYLFLRQCGFKRVGYF